jgi:hypothetical protein
MKVTTTVDLFPEIVVAEDEFTPRIRNREFVAQIKDFSGMEFGKLRPTDIDGALESRGKAFAFFEIKRGELDPPTGQRLLFERLCDAVHRPEEGRHAIFFLSAHYSHGDIPVAETSVYRCRWQGEWHDIDVNWTLHEAIQNFLSEYGR